MVLTVWFVRDAVAALNLVHSPLPWLDLCWTPQAVDRVICQRLDSFHCYRSHCEPSAFDWTVFVSSVRRAVSDG